MKVHVGGAGVRLGARGRAIGLLVATGLLAACSGPLPPLAVDVHGQPTDIVLGSQIKAVVDAAVPPFQPSLTPGGSLFSLPNEFVLPPSGGPRPTAPPVLGPCPEADPLAPPPHESGNDVSKAPAQASYVYRSLGSFDIGGANAKKGLYDATAKHTITPLAPVVGQPYFEFDDQDEINGGSTTVRYRVVPQNGTVPGGTGTVTPTTQPPTPSTTIANQGAGGPAVPGIYIASIQRSDSSTPATVFNGNAGWLLTTLPLSENSSFDSTASDGTNTYRYTSTTGLKARVDACGTWIETYTLEVTGTIAQGGSTTPAVCFTNDFNLAPQFGGLSVHTKKDVKSCQVNATPVTDQLEETINREPVLPK